MKVFNSSFIKVLIAGFPLLFLSPFVGFDLFNYLLQNVKVGNGFLLFLLLVLLVGGIGGFLMDSYRRLSFLMFVGVCWLGWWQGYILKQNWSIWIEKGYEALVATFALNLGVLLLIPLVIIAARSRLKVEKLVVISFKIVLLVQVFAIILSCLYFYGNYKVNPFGLIVLSELPVIDSFGVRNWSSRFSGIVPSPNEAGALFLLMWPALLLNYPSVEDRGKFILRTLFLISVVVGLLLTYSRASYLGLCIQLLFLFAIVMRSGRFGNTSKNSLLIFLIPFLSVLLLSFLSQDFRLRWLGMLNPTDASVGNRIKVFSSALMMLVERPFCGWGVGTFNTLYNVYYKIPLVTYGFADGHSAILLSLLNIGIGGWALIVIAVFGLNPWKTFRILPVWVSTALIGIVIPLLTDNVFTRKLAISVPLCLLTGIIYLYSQRWEGKKRRNHFVGYSVVCGVAVLWIVNFLMPPTSPADRLEMLTTQVASRARAEISLVVKNHSTQESFEVKPDISYPSYLATVAVAAVACESLKSTVIDVPYFKFSPSMEQGTTVSLPALDWMKFLLSNPMHESSGELYNSIPSPALADAKLKIFPNTITGTVGLPDNCFSCSTGENRDQVSLGLGLKNKLTTVTLTQLLDAFYDISNPSRESGIIGGRALAGNRDYTGFLRYIPYKLDQYHCSADLGDIREEILYVDKGVMGSWSVGMYYHSDSPMQVRTDSLSNRIFADIGWRLYCYFEALEPMAKSHFGTYKNKGKSGFWFLKEK